MVDISARQLAIYALEFGLAAAGLGVWAQFQLNRSTRGWRSSRLPHWDISITAFLLLCFQVMIAGVIGGALTQGIIALLPKPWHPDPDFALMVTNLGLQLGVFAGVLASRRLTGDQAPGAIAPPLVTLSPRLSTRGAVLAGILTFLAAFPAVALVSFLWQALLSACGIVTEKQDLLDLFGKIHDPGKLAVMITIATVIAPLTEELAFRAGFFHFLRGRLPRFWAYFIPAAVFALLHWNLSVFAPLLALGLLFSLAYQRTGRILVTVIAHGLFNLNTVIVVLSGVNL